MNSEPWVRPIVIEKVADDGGLIPVGFRSAYLGPIPAGWKLADDQRLEGNPGPCDCEPMWHYVCQRHLVARFDGDVTPS